MVGNPILRQFPQFMRRTALLASLSFTVLSVLPAPALADKKLAKKMLKAAKTLMKAGNVDGAIARLTSAWEVVPSSKIAKTLVKAYDQKGDAVEAAKFVAGIVKAKAPKKLVRWAKKKKKAYAKTLAKLNKKKDAAAAAAAEAAAKEATKQEKEAAENARLEKEEKKARADARAKQKVKTAPEPPPKKAKKKKAEKKKKKEKKKEVAKAEPKADPDFDEDMESSYVPPPDPTWTFFGWTAAGLGVAALGAGTFFLLQKNGKQQEANDCAADSDIRGGRCAQATYNNLVDDMDSAFVFELSSWATAGFAALTAAGLFAFTPPVELDAGDDASAGPFDGLRLHLSPLGGLLSGEF